MARDGSSSERGRLGRLIDRLLGRDRADTGDSTALFTAHQPPPSGRRPGAEVSPSEPDLFRERPRRQPRDAREETPVVSAEPIAESKSLQTAVHQDALEQVSPRARQAPGVRVHDDHLEQRSGPVQLTPSQAIELARGGRDTLRRGDRD